MGPTALPLAVLKLTRGCQPFFFFDGASPLHTHVRLPVSWLPTLSPRQGDNFLVAERRYGGGKVTPHTDASVATAVTASGSSPLAMPGVGAAAAAGRRPSTGETRSSGGISVLSLGMGVCGRARKRRLLAVQLVHSSLHGAPLGVEEASAQAARTSTLFEGIKVNPLFESLFYSLRDKCSVHASYVQSGAMFEVVLDSELMYLVA